MIMNINYSNDILDTNDLDTRLDELEESLDGLTPEQLADAEEDVAELKELKEAKKYMGNDWLIGTELVNEDHFEEYVREREEEKGTLDKLESYIVIDWEQTAEIIQSDYSVVELMGSTFYYS